MKHKSPAFQFYYKEWIVSTITMSRVERDIYLLLLIASYDLGGLPDDFEQLYKIAFCKNKKEKSILFSIISSKFIKNNFSKFVNFKMEQVRENQIEFSKSRMKAGKLGADKRWHSHKVAIGLPLAKHSSASTTPTTTTTTNINTVQQQHEDFLNEFFLEKNKIDLEQMSMCLREKKIILPKDAKEFNAHLHTENKYHADYHEWKKHFRNWLNKKPYLKIKSLKLQQKNISDNEVYKNSKSVL